MSIDNEFCKNKFCKNKFIKKLNFDIINHKKNITNSKRFIKYKNLEMYNCLFSEKTFSEYDLPIESLLGSIFLIKNNNILEFYSWCDYNHSMYLQINKKKSIWLGKPLIINIEHNDPEDLIFLLDGYDFFYNPSNWQYFITQFLDSGFKIYLKKSLINNI